MYPKPHKPILHNVGMVIALVLTPLLLATATLVTAQKPVQAASHREAPLISMDAEADITDFFMFRSYEPGKADKVVFIMNVIPGEEPSSGPNYFNFDPNVSYKFEIDNDGDGATDDINFEFRFTNEFRGTAKAAGLFQPQIALPGPITKLDGPGSEGLGWRQKYTVSMSKKGDKDKIGKDLIVVPSNVGPRTMPNYADLAAQGIYDIGDGVRVFAGQRDDPFYIDLGATFDTLNFRRAPLLTAAEDANDNVNPFGVDMLAGFNVNTIAIEVPIAWLTKDGKDASTTKFPKIGAYASTSRRSQQVLRSSGINSSTPGSATVSAAAAPEASNTGGLYLPYVAGQVADATDQAEANAVNGVYAADNNFIQVQRLANPLVNEVIIGTQDKDRWNALEPKEESKFLDYYLNSRFAFALKTVFGFDVPPNPRNDLVNLLLKYQPTDKRLSELLRLDVSVAPTLLASQKRLTVLAGDNAGWPNGRRPKDDVVDIATRVVGGSNYINARVGDGVNTNDKPLPDTFPFLATPWDGVTRVHANPK